MEVQVTTSKLPSQDKDWAGSQVSHKEDARPSLRTSLWVPICTLILTARCQGIRYQGAEFRVGSFKLVRYLGT